MGIFTRLKIFQPDNPNLAKDSDVPAPAWPESPSFGLALGGLGLRKS